MEEAAGNKEEVQSVSKNVLEFFVAYQQVGNQKRYLGNGKGGVRLFKERENLEAYLREKLTPFDFERTVIHSVTGNFAVPEPDDQRPAMVPITTLFPDNAPPTAEDLLKEVVKARKRHKPRGKT